MHHFYYSAEYGRDCSDWGGGTRMVSNQFYSFTEASPSIKLSKWSYTCHEYYVLLFTFFFGRTFQPLKSISQMEVPWFQAEFVIFLKKVNFIFLVENTVIFFSLPKVKPVCPWGVTFLVPVSSFPHKSLQGCYLNQWKHIHEIQGLLKILK